MAGDHKCPVCNATFTRPQHVARHMRSHTGDRPYKCQHCGDQFARSDLLSRHVNKCHAAEKPATTTAPNRRKGSASASRATTSKQACDQCVVTNLPCDGSNPCSKCISRKCRCTYVKFHRQTAPVGPGHPAPNAVDKHSQHSHFSMDSIIPSEEYLLSHPQNAAVAMGSVGSYLPNTMPSADFTFPAAMFSRSSSLPTGEQGSHQHNSPSPDHSSPDFVTRYRAQAELLSRAGVLFHGQIGMSPSLQEGMSTGGHQTQQQQQQQQQQQLYNADRYSAPWLNGDRQIHESMDEVLYHAHRPHSQAGYPNSLSNNFLNSSGDQFTFRYGNREGLDDLSDSTSDRGHSEQGHSSSDHSFYDSPSVPQTAPNHVLGEPGREHHEGFSSSFGLMSLDDPNVVAGIASDGTPFFTHVNVSGENGAQILHQVRDDLLVGMGLKSKIEGPLETNGHSGNGLTSRETELRELRDFWKQYMRTPLSAPHQPGSNNGFPLATPTPNNLHGIGQLDVPGKPSPSKKLARVASLPSVKTPPLHSEVGPLGQPQVNSQNHYHNFVSNNNNSAAPQRSNTYIHSQMTTDDLKSYEQAVLARKAPTLSLVPRKRPGTGNAGDLSAGGRFSNPSTTSSSPVVPQQPLENRATDTRAASSRPSSADSSSSADGVGGRPSYKRMPSTTLGPANSKRTLLSVEGGEWSGTDGHDTRRILGDVLTTEPTSTTMLNHQMVAQQDTHRRMSAPVAAHDHK